MINVTILNKKQLITYLVKIILVITAIVILTRFFINLKEKQEIEKTIPILENTDLTVCMDIVMPSIRENSEKISITNRSSNRYTDLLGIELPMTNYVVAKADTNVIDIALNNDSSNIPTSSTEEISSSPETAVVSEKNKPENYNNTYGTVKIKNETGYGLTEEMLKPDITLSNNKDILLFHTHTCESYTTSEQYNYTMTGNYRTTDLSYNISRVGDELESYLKGFGYNVLHDRTLHDYPAYSGSYGRSLETVQNLLNSNKGIEAVIDVHRDALGSMPDYAPCVQIGDEKAAQLMFVIGTDGGGLTHPNWNQNLKFAIKIQEKANEMYPGLFRPIILRKSRYNQHLTNAATILEVGATGNTLEETLVSMKYFSKVLSEVMK